MKTIGILATGNEIVEGKIVNTNASWIAAHLTSRGAHVQYHFAVSDNKAEIKQLFSYLLNQVDCVICIGGLGPTSDDNTRFSISDSLGLELIFHQEAWQHVEARFRQLNIPIHESNRQQALFPPDTKILPNPHGTASGGQITHQKKLIYLLPGPPNECHPMFLDYVLPHLIKQGYGGDRKIYTWRVIGVVEADIAADLDVMAKQFGLQTGYRVVYPYLEFKLIGNHAQFTPEIFKKFSDFLAPNFVTHEDKSALELLKQKMKSNPFLLSIDDQATRGLFSATLMDPQTQKWLCPEEDTPEVCHVSINGLDNFWSGVPAHGKESLSVDIQYRQNFKQYSYLIPYRDQEIRLAAVEYIAYSLLKLLT